MELVRGPVDNNPHPSKRQKQQRNIRNRWDGDTNTYIYNGGRVYKYHKAQIIHVVVSSFVTKIENQAFERCQLLEDVHFLSPEQSRSSPSPSPSRPSSSSSSSSPLLEIGGRAFFECPRLHTVRLPSSVKIIGKKAFCGCLRLVSPVLFPNPSPVSTFSSSSSILSSSSPTLRQSSLTVIGKDAFLACHFLRSIELSNEFKALGVYAFGGCRRLSVVKFPKNSPMKEIPMNCFRGCRSLETVSLYEPIHTIGQFAFAKSIYLQRVVLPRSIRYIQNHAFSACSNLKIIDYFDPTTHRPDEEERHYFWSNGTGAFIRIPKGIEYISTNAFVGCRYLTDLTDHQTVVHLSDVYYAKQFLKRSDNSPASLRPYVLSQPPPSISRTDRENLSSKEQQQIRHLSFVFYLLVRDGIMWAS